jgi:hypothetical protein
MNNLLKNQSDHQDELIQKQLGETVFLGKRIPSPPPSSFISYHPGITNIWVESTNERLPPPNVGIFYKAWWFSSPASLKYNSIEEKTFFDFAISPNAFYPISSNKKYLQQEMITL